MALHSPEIDRREFLRILGVIGLGAVIESCAPRSTGFPKESTPFLPETIPTVEKGKGPAGKLLLFTNPEAKYGHEYLEQYPEQIEESEMVLVNPDGNEQKGIINSNLISSPVWSPSGDMFAFQRYERRPHFDSSDLWIFDKDGNRLRRIDLRPSPANLSWSPDGKLIVLSSRFYNSRFQRVFGWPPEQRTSWIDGIYTVDPHKEEYTTTRIIPSSSEFDHDPAISPDGLKIVFITHTFGAKFSIFLAPLRPYKYEERYSPKSGIYEIDSGLDSLMNASVRFQWTPDGKKIVYMLERGNQNRLYIADVAKLPPSRPLEIKLDYPSYAMNESFISPNKLGPPVKQNYHMLDSMDLSPDGRQIVVGGPGALLLTDIEGRNKKTIKLPKTLSSPLDNVRWLSGNSQIAFTHADKYYYINSDGSELMEVSFAFIKRSPDKQVALGILISTGN